MVLDGRPDDFPDEPRRVLHPRQAVQAWDSVVCPTAAPQLAHRVMQLATISDVFHDDVYDLFSIIMIASHLTI